MTEFRAGQRVHVEYDGVIEIATGPFTYNVRVEDHSTQVANVDHMTAIDPAHWPPVQGDIWELDGQEFVVRDSIARPGTLVALNLHNPRTAVRYVPGDERFKQAKLIRRRGGFER